MTDDLSHRGIDRVMAALRAHGWDGTVRTFPDGVRTAKAAAEALGCEVGAIANSLLFEADGSPVLVLTSGAHRVDPDLVATTIGVAVLGRANPDFVRTHTGQAIGGVAPVGHPAPVPTYLDRALARYDVIWAAAGHSHAVFNTTYHELRTLTGAVEIDVE
ncbi:MAG: YbaK/EbsC family protein [Nocardioidaceae bacterium]|nr:YbaK/EbsC family protein [Nocardioidaceae bacterium]